MPIPEGEELLTISELVIYAASVGRRVSAPTVYKWVHDGLETGDLGGITMTSKQAFWRYLNRPKNGDAPTLSAADLQRSREAAARLDAAGWREVGAK